MASSISQFGIVTTFDNAYPVGQFVNGDYFVLPNGTTYPRVTSVTPTYNATTGQNGITVNPVFSGANGWRAVATGPSSTTQYSAALNVALNLPYQLAAGDAFMPSIGSTNNQHSNNRPYLERVIVITCLATAPPTGSFRPPYVAGSTKTLYNTADIDWNAIPNATAPATAPSWATVSNEVNRGPFIRLGTNNTAYRLIQPALQMQAYGADLASDNCEVLLRLCTAGTQAEKESTVIGFIQRGIDVYAINQRVIDTGFTNADGLGIWGAWSGGHGIGTKEPVFFAAVAMPSRTEFATACAYLPYRYWCPDGQCFVKTERISAGCSQSAADWLQSFYGYDEFTVSIGERPFARPTNTNNGIPGYLFDTDFRASYHNMQGACARALALSAQLMDAQDTYGYEPTLIFAEIYANGPEGGDSIDVQNGPNYSAFQRDMWNLHYVNEYT